MATIQVTVLDPRNKSELRRFVTLERSLMAKYPLYWSEIDADVVKLLKKKSHFSVDMDFCLFVATNDGKDVARCAAIISKKFQDEIDKQAGFIGFFAASENCQTEVTEMLTRAETWLKDHHITRIIAPCNGGAPQNMGCLITGYDQSPMFPFMWTPPYYNEYIKGLDYSPTYPMWVYDVDFSSDAYKKAKQIYSNIQQASIRSVTKKTWNKDLDIIRELLNRTFVDEWEFSTLSSGMMKEFFGPMKSILEADQMQIAEVDGKPVGFCFGMPDLTPLFRSFNGNLGLVGIVRLLMRAKKYERAGILGIGVLPEYRGQGISKALAMRVYAHHEKKGLSRSFYYPVNESNVGSRKFAESIGGTGRVRLQVYDKVLN